MDPATHLLSGLLVARSGAHRLTRGASVALATGAVLPDLDLVFLYGATPTLLQFHLGWTHSPLGAAALGTLSALGFWLRARRQQPPKQFGARILLASWLGIATHLLLDLVTARGIHPLWPFKDVNLAFDWFAGTDPWLLAVFLLGLTVPLLFRLIGEEIGARADPRAGQRGAWAGIVLFLLLCAVRGSLHAEAVARLDGQSYRGRVPLNIGAFPHPVNPFLWMGVVETDSTFELVEVRLRDPEPGTRIEFTYYKPPPSPALEAARTSPIARAFLHTARFPLARVEPIPNGHRILLRDLRSTPTRDARPAIVAQIELDQNLRVQEEGFHRAAPD